MANRCGSASRRARGRDGRPGEAQAAARHVPSGERRVHPRLPDHRRLARRHRCRRLSANSPARRSTEFSTRKVMRRGLGAFARFWTTCRWPPAPDGPQGRGGGGGASLRRREPPRALSERAAERGPVRGAAAGRGRLVERSRIIMEKPFGTDLASAIVAQRQAARGVRRGADLPHRPFPRQGAGAEHPRVPLRQRLVRADLEPQLHRPRADRRARDARARQARPAFYERPARIATWWSRTCSRSSAFMAMEPPTALEPAPISEEKNKVFRSMLPIDPKDVVRGQYTGYRRGGRRPRVGHRNLHRAEMLDRQLALGRRAVLPAHRQADGRGAAHHFHRVSRAAEEHVPGRGRASARRARTI
jgi:hypothetical protein